MNALKERRGCSFRIELSRLVYLPLLGDLAFLLNVSEGGMAIQAMQILQSGQSVQFVLPLPDSQAELTGVAEIVWADRSGRAGLKFANISPLDRFRLIEWMIQTQERNPTQHSTLDFELAWN